MSEPWLSKAGVSWALWRAPNVPARLVATLIAIAAYTDENGQGAYPSAQTIADCTRKTERQAKRDIAELVKLGLLVPGNWRLTAHLRADRRPNVYDLPMLRGVTQDTPHGVTPKPSRSASRGDTQGRTGGHAGSNGVTPMSPKDFHKKSEEAALAGARPSAAPAAPGKCVDCGSAYRSGTAWGKQDRCESCFREYKQTMAAVDANPTRCSGCKAAGGPGNVLQRVDGRPYCARCAAVRLLVDYGLSDADAQLIVEWEARSVDDEPMTPQEVLDDVQLMLEHPDDAMNGLWVAYSDAVRWKNEQQGAA